MLLERLHTLLLELLLQHFFVLLGCGYLFATLCEKFFELCVLILEDSAGRLGLKLVESVGSLCDLMVFLCDAHLQLLIFVEGLLALVLRLHELLLHFEEL